jgi:tetratricopeptide (TPR) repeat protein
MLVAMKHIRPIAMSLLTASALLLSACQDVLDREPQGVFTLANFFENEEHAVLATNAVYNYLRNWEVHVFSYIGMTDIASDDADKGSFPADAFFLQELDDFSHNATNLAPQTVWGGYYTGIFRANLAIDGIPKVPEMDENLRARLIGECKFLRAYYYFNLVRWFGDLPLITQPFPENFEIPRTPKDKIYEQIIADLEDAAAVLPLRSAQTPSDLGRATSGAAKGMLAKVYLTLGNFPEAERYALEVINSGQYSLWPDYSTLFMEEGENSQESLFEVQAASYEQGGGGSQYSEVQGVRGTPNLGWGFNRPSNNLVSSYEPGDPRREATILYVGEVLPDGSAIIVDNPDIIGERYNQKSWRPLPVGGNGNGGANILILRYADVLLMAAEALNENNKPDQALIYLNQVRARARAGSNVLPNVTITNKDQLRQRIWRERRSELAMEQGRWFDLARQNRLAEVLQAAGKPFVAGKHELWPIPQNDIDLSNGVLTQNPGY